MARRRARHPECEFLLFLAGQAVSDLGSAFTTIALPLLVFRLTGSATDLAAATAASYLPWLAFGLLGGALVDRLDRKRLLIVTDLARAAATSIIPILQFTGGLRVDWIYAVLVVQACLQILFSAGEVIAVMALVEEADRVRANSRLQASQSAARLAGSALAGLLFAVAPIPDALLVDAASFLVSAATLAAIRPSFNATPALGLSGAGAGAGATETIRQLLAETKAGVAYVWHHPLLRSLSLQVGAVNLFGSAATSEVALLAIKRLGADNSKVSFLQGASSLGVIALSFATGRLADRLSLGAMILSALVLYGSGIAVLGIVTSYAAGVALWAIVGAGTLLYNVGVVSLRQRLVPPEMMGRVWNVGVTIAWSAIPVGSLAGGAVISATGQVGTVYVVVGAAIVVTALVVNRHAFRRTGSETDSLATPTPTPTPTATATATEATPLPTPAAGATTASNDDGIRFPRRAL